MDQAVEYTDVVKASSEYSFLIDILAKIVPNQCKLCRLDTFQRYGYVNDDRNKA